jgi:AraC-like DNA-binding protein
VEVIFSHRWPRHTDALAEHLGAPVRFGGDAVRMIFEKPRLDSFFSGADPDLARLLASATDEPVAPHPPIDRLRNRVTRMLTRALAEEDVLSTRNVARALRLSGRTLRRRLHAEGTSTRELVDEVRHEGALTLLERGHATLDEVAARLGFSSASAFRRAFRRWTGKAPTSAPGDVTGTPPSGSRR